MFSGVVQCRLQRPTSDHFPILLMGGGLRRGPTPFRFEKHQVEYWDGVESERCLSLAETEQKKEAKDAFHKWVLLEEVHWRQKSRELWLKEGDRNTGYFHRMANAHRRNNSLDRIMINGEWLTEDQEGLHLNQITSREAEDLEKPFTEEEVHGALMEMRGDKAPGPDGFTMAFWQECWPFVKEEMMDLFKEFFEYGSFSKCLNNSFLVLIPKKGGAEDLGDFRPISLLGGLYKILAKVLANRLKKVLDRVVSADQNAFVRGRQILDASLVANEVIDYWHKKKEKGCFGRWDLGCVGWIGCGGVSPQLNFPFLINGVPAGFFPNSKGLRQGDPLSPYLFILGMEVDELEEMAAELGCRLGALPTVYLGLPLGAYHKTSSSWDGVEERMRKRLAQWKRQYISKGGRITLIKSTLASIPTYFLSLIRIPKSVTRRIEKIQRDFLWGGGRLERKAHLIKWKVVCSPKEEGGLGIRKIEVLNKALLGKWVWRYAYEKENLWKRGDRGEIWSRGCGWRTKDGCGPYGVGLWKEIMKEADWCWESIVFKVGKGTRILFWMDKWCGNEALSQMFPQLFTWQVIGMPKTSTEEDAVRWKRESNGVFGAKGAYKILVGSSACVFPNRRIWMDKVPTKVSFFAWEASWGKILTLDKLQRKGWQLPNRCFLCGCEEESANHIMLHCTVVKILWEIALAIFRVQWVFPESVIEVLLSWRGSFVGEKKKRHLEFHSVVHFLDGLEGKE
ncbi:putative ribonuclease H protein [Vitis vinifera]|uniref:Putative ribonuclease H protein n=1 Tax=Vitis vinifera TaxID=29760 RepID=A0A438JF59_VITVI|nr:putative ribonuclease H protein [Vitis vinifera]